MSGGTNGGVWIAYDLSAAGHSNCGGVYQIGTDGTGTWPSVQVALDCGGNTGAGVTANLKWVYPSGTPLTCVFVNFNDGSNAYLVVCGPSQSTAGTCALGIASSIGNGATVTSPGDTWRFVP